MHYYIAMHDAGRSVLIAGPYDTEEAAESSRRAAKDKAYEYDAKSWFYTSSLAKSEAVMKTAFGRV